MKKIRIAGYIGYDYSSGSIAIDLKDAGGEDLDIQIASPGGSVFDGIDIFNQIRDYRRDFPKAQITITLKGLAASMASYIAAVPVADKVRAEDNAVFMIHNPWSASIGDHREAQKTADFLKGLASLLADAYVKRSRKSRAEIVAMMDAETWLFGEEIKEAGFVDEIIESTDDKGKPSASAKDKAAAIGAARVEFVKMQKLMSDAETPEDIDKAAALIRPLVKSAHATHTTETENQQTPGVAGQSITTPEGEGKEGKTHMTLEELKAKEPALYAEAVAAGVKKENERVTKCLILMEKPSMKTRDTIVARIVKGMKDGEEVVTIQDAAMSLLDADLDSAGHVATGITNTGSGESDDPAKQTEVKAEWKPGQIEEV